MAATEADVLIAGLGPVGAALAALLAREGVRVIVCERETEIYRLPRAAHFDAEIMRLFQHLGIAEAMLPHTRTIDSYDFVNAAGEMLMQFGASRETAQGWASGYLFHQPALEGLLRETLAKAGVETLTGWALDRFSEEGDIVTAHLTHGSETRTVTAQYLVGCDGANSLVRKALGIGLDDYGFDEPWLVVDTIMKDESRLKPHGVQLCDPARPVTIMPMSPGRRRWEFMLQMPCVFAALAAMAPPPEAPVVSLALAIERRLVTLDETPAALAAPPFRPQAQRAPPILQA
jgi:3-(3-hydroxy-phenyl)propionate hydroxylase